MFLHDLPPQDTPHYCSHAHQMAFKTNPDRENRPWFCIPAFPRKLTDSGTMHHNYSKISLSLSVSALWNHTRTSIIYHHQRGRNLHWERSTCRHVMGCDKPTVATLTLTPHGIIPACLWPMSQGRPTRSEYRGKRGPNVWIRQLHHNNYHWQPIMGGARQERRFIDHPHHI